MLSETYNFSKVPVSRGWYCSNIPFELAKSIPVVSFYRLYRVRGNNLFRCELNVCMKKLQFWPIVSQTPDHLCQEVSGNVI